MKNLKSGLFILFLVSLICVFVPGRALAQDGSDDPCCHRVPSSITAVNSSVLQGEIELINSIDFDMAVNGRFNATATPDRLSLTVLAIPVVKEESWAPGNRRQS